MRDADSHVLLRKRSIHLLIDPDRWTDSMLARLFASHDIATRIASLIVGGTYNHSGNFTVTMEACKNSGVTIGNFLTAGPIDSLLSPMADYVVIPLALGGSARFVTDHVIAAAPTIQRYGLGVVRVAYLQLDGGRATSAGFFTQMLPIPRERPEIVHTLALAGKQLGVDAIYLEAGSDAKSPITIEEVDAALSGSLDLPVIVGGGIHTRNECNALFAAGATALIIGSALEREVDISWLPLS